MERKELGKVQRFDVGLGGYQGVMLGVSIDLGGAGWGVSDFKGFWSPSQIQRSDSAQWTEESRSKAFDEVMRFIDKTLHEAKVKQTHELVGIPVEVTFENTTLKSWRVLTEVL